MVANRGNMVVSQIFISVSYSEVRADVLRLCYLRHKYESHGQVATEHVGQADKGEASIGLVGDDEGDRGCDETEHCHVVDGHPHQAAVVDLLYL